jgi:hypothetical protein
LRCSTRRADGRYGAQASIDAAYIVEVAMDLDGGQNAFTTFRLQQASGTATCEAYCPSSAMPHPWQDCTKSYCDLVAIAAKRGVLAAEA